MTLIFFLVVLTLPAVCIYQSHILDQEPTDEKCIEQLNLVLINLDHVYHGASFFTNTIIVLVWCMYNGILYNHGWNCVVKKDTRGGNHDQ